MRPNFDILSREVVHTHSHPIPHRHAQPTWPSFHPHLQQHQTRVHEHRSIVLPLHRKEVYTLQIQNAQNSTSHIYASFTSPSPTARFRIRIATSQQNTSLSPRNIPPNQDHHASTQNTRLHNRNHPRIHPQRLRPSHHGHVGGHVSCDEQAAEEGAEERGVGVGDEGWGC